ncbi:DExH-box ATP-dependent RNA helicase DExH1 [Camellia lanceoleosa]|uniref:DExH-box ATP-dependent RNA helicase DExH1 n=1 Tax=Camellia lanceoleosa TaxID=1840588 RepID=A0ACC0HS38_9ERIC|nr:DExH-box ATP-dependent RNA helicase DExH1 [Camellia lanceoleosa]
MWEIAIMFNLKSGINNICCHESDGAILVFLTGWDDISKLLEKIKANSLLRDPSKFLVLPLHGSMPTINQCEIFDRLHANVRG